MLGAPIAPYPPSLLTILPQCTLKNTVMHVLKPLNQAPDCGDTLLTPKNQLVRQNTSAFLRRICIQIEETEPGRYFKLILYSVY